MLSLGRHRNHGMRIPNAFAIGRVLYYAWMLLVVAAASLVKTSRAEESSIIKNQLQKGCLYNKLASHNQLRVCNSEDYLETGADPVERGICRAPEFDYLEVRIKCQVGMYLVMLWSLPSSVPLAYPFLSCSYLCYCRTGNQ